MSWWIDYLKQCDFKLLKTYSQMSKEVKNVKYSFYWGHSAFNPMLQITAGKFMKYVSLHIPSQAGNTVVRSKKKESGHSAYKSKEKMHVDSQSSSFGKSCI